MDFLVAGLGNIGAEYAHTRHNIGFMILDAWAQASDISFVTARYGDRADLSFKGRRFRLLKPSTYMNLSGKAIRYWMQELNIPIERLIVICDDLNLPFGTARMRASGSDGGHNGLKNINELIGGSNYARIRLGIGNDFARGSQIDFVLGSFSAEEEAFVGRIAPKVIDAVRTFALAGADKAMSGLNRDWRAFLAEEDAKVAENAENTLKIDPDTGKSEKK